MGWFDGDELIPRPLLRFIILVVTVIWACSAVVDMLPVTDYDGTGINLIFGSVVGGLIGLDQRQERKKRDGRRDDE